MSARFWSLAAAGIVAVSMASADVALAQPPSQVGQVGATEGPEGSVLVVRGSETFSLQSGDALFNEDQVFTRSNGEVVLAFANCTRELGPASSVIVDAEVCTVPLIQLSSNDVVGGVTVGAGGGGGVGATPTFIAGLFAAGGAAAAAGGDDGPSSP